MGRGKELSASQKAVIRVFHEEGWSTRAIAGKVGCNQTSVVRQLANLKQKGSIDRAPGRGRRKILTERGMRKLKHNCIANRRASYSDHRKMLEDKLDIKISAYTVRDNLVKAGFIARIPQKSH